MKTSRFVFGSGLLSAAILMTGMFGVAEAQTEGIPIARVPKGSAAFRTTWRRADVAGKRFSEEVR
jgi:hypothetical protein